MKIEDSNSLATIVGPTLGSSSMKGKCVPSVALNSDVHYINMFYILENQPRPLRVVYANINPYSVPIALTSATSDMCLCRDQMWPVTSDLGSVDFLKFSLATVWKELSNFTASLNNERCTCFVNNTIKWTGNENQQHSPILTAPNHFFSAFVFLPQIISEEREVVTDGSGSSHVVSFAVESQYQLIKTKISFQSQPGQLQSALASRSVAPSWTVGRPNSLDIDFSVASFGVNLDWMFRFWYRVIPASTAPVASYVLSLVENRVNLVSNNLSWVGSLRPLSLCRTRLLGMDDEAPLLLLTGSEAPPVSVPDHAPEQNIFQCLHDMLSVVVDDTTATAAVMVQLTTVQTELSNGTTVSGNLSKFPFIFNISI